MDPDIHTKLLWTGGWDSTFRLLQLLNEEKKKVRPYYIIDPKRKSTGVEIQCMFELKNSIHQKYPHSKSLFLPVSYVNIDSIELDESITKAFNQLNKYTHLGSQFEWLSRLSKQYKFQKIEIAVENTVGDKNRNEYSKCVRKFICNNFSDNPAILSERERSIFTASKTLYQHFRFPILHLTKQNMFEAAREKGWLSILKNTWFCYYPLYFPYRRLNPCGTCITCKRQLNYGLKWRISSYLRIFQKAISFINRRRFTSH